MTMRRIKTTLLPLLLITIAFAVCYAAGGGLRASNTKYLYAGNAFPVIEYMVDDALEGEEEEAFLASSPSSYRLVQFYDPSSAARRDARDTFVQTAQAVTELAPRFNVTLETYAVSCAAHAEICENHAAIAVLPLFALYRPNSSEQMVIPAEELTVQSLRAKLGMKRDDEDEDEPESDETLARQPRATRTRQELENDVHLALHGALRDVHNSRGDGGSPAGGGLSKERRDVLRQFLLLLSKTLPRQWPVRSTVQKALKQFQFVTKKPAYLNKILGANLPSNPQYSSACRQHDDKSSTAQCGTWELLHVVSVNVVEYNSEQSSHKERLPTLEVAKILRDYVREFGLLEGGGGDRDGSDSGDDDDAGEQFVREVTQCQRVAAGNDEQPCQSRYFSLLTTVESTADSDVLDWIQLPIYISELHNRVRNNTAQQQSGRGNMKHNAHHFAWPPRRDCPSCWNVETGQWNEQTVYRYLQLEYTAKGELLSTGARAELLQMPLPTRRRRSIGRPNWPVASVQSSLVGLPAALFLLRAYLSHQRKSKRGRLLDKAD